MNLQVLIATMNQQDHSLIERMNINSDVIVGNQCNRNEVEEFIFKGNKVKWLSFNERGVGLNRNNTLMRADADICLFADDDVVYFDDYKDKVLNAYKDYPEADVIIFNMRVTRDGVNYFDKVTKTERIGRSKAGTFGAVSITARTKSLKFKNIVFHRMFGGGTEYSCGEDTIFLQDCIKRGLRVYTYATTIGWVNNEISTWFKGYDDKYFYDKGVLFGYLYPKLAKFLCVYHVVKHRNLYKEYSLKKAILKMWEGTDLYL